MTTNLTVATASGKRRVTKVFCILQMKPNNFKCKVAKLFAFCKRFATYQTRPKAKSLLIRQHLLASMAVPQKNRDNTSNSHSQILLLQSPSSVPYFSAVISKVVRSRRQRMSEAKHSTTVPVPAQSREGESTSKLVLMLQQTMMIMGLSSLSSCEEGRERGGF